jgi:hypothetical protein
VIVGTPVLLQCSIPVLVFIVAKLVSFTLHVPPDVESYNERVAPSQRYSIDGQGYGVTLSVMCAGWTLTVATVVANPQPDIA